MALFITEIDFLDIYLMNFGANYLISQQFKNVQKLISVEKYEEAEKKLNEISSSLSVIDFNPNDGKFKKDVLPLLLNTCLPLTSHVNIRLRHLAQTILHHWSSLLSAFSPSVLISYFNTIEASTLQPEAYSAILIFCANSLRYIEPTERYQYIGIIHSLLISSNPSNLAKVTNDVWGIIREALPKESILSILPIIINSPLSSAVSFICQKSPDPLLYFIMEKGSMDFVKDVLRNWPLSTDVNIKRIYTRLIAKISGSNSSEISTSIEILSIIISKDKSNYERYDHEWLLILKECESLWNSPRITISQKAAMIDLVSRLPTINIEQYNKFLSYESIIPIPMLVSIVILSGKIVNKSIIPTGFVSFLRLRIVERDPLIYESILECLSNCFNELYMIIPEESKKLFELAINPLPKYFVEQISLINLINSIDVNRIGFRIDCQRIIFEFLKNPHPSVVAELPKIIRKFNLNLPFTQMNWFDYAQDYISLFDLCDPFFVMEVIDSQLISPSSFSSALMVIMKGINQNSSHNCALCRRSLYIIYKGSKSLGFASKSHISDSSDKHWGFLTNSFSDMLSMIDDNLINTTFGQIMNSSVLLLNQTIASIPLKYDLIEDLFEFSCELASAFSSSLSLLVPQLWDIFLHSQFASSQSKSKKIVSYVRKFFSQPFPFDYSIDIIFSASKCLAPIDIYEILKPYFLSAAFRNREVFRTLLSIVPSYRGISRGFLELNAQDDEYISKCIIDIPFSQWIIYESDIEFISRLKGIYVDTSEQLSHLHKTIIQNCSHIFNLESEDLLDFGSQNINLDGFCPISQINDMNIIENDFLEPAKIESIQPNIEICIYKHEPLSLSTLKLFLFHSDRTLDLSTWSKIESYCLSQWKEHNLVFSFMAYSTRHNLEIDIIAWSKLLDFDFQSKVSIMTSIMYLYHVQDRWETLNQSVLDFVEMVMHSNGYIDVSKESVLSLFLSNNGLVRLIAQSIMHIDPIYFGDMLPSIKFLFMNKTQFFENFESFFDSFSSFTSQEFEIILQIISSMLFTPLPHSLYKDITIPHGIPFFNCLEKSSLGIEKMQDSLLSPYIIDKLITISIEHNHLNDIFVTLLSRVSMTESQYIGFLSSIKVFGVAHPLYCRVLVSSPTIVNEMDHFSLFIRCSPPSYTRHILRTLLSSQCPILEEKITKRMLKRLRPVFFELLYSSYLTVSHSLCDDSFGRIEESALETPPYDSQALRQAQWTMGACETVSPRIVSKICELDDEKIRALYSLYNTEGTILQFSQDVMNNVRDKMRFAQNIIPVVKRLCDRIPVSLLIRSIYTDAYCSSDNPFPIYIAASIILKKAKDTNEPYFDSIKSGLGKVSSNKVFAKALESQNGLEIIMQN